MDELSRQVLKHFIAMGAESLDLHTLFEAGGNDPASRQGVLDAVTRLAFRLFGITGQRLLLTHR